MTLHVELEGHGCCMQDSAKRFNLISSLLSRKSVQFKPDSLNNLDNVNSDQESGERL